jgi:hypothetical protein
VGTPRDASELSELKTDNSGELDDSYLKKQQILLCS